MRGAVRVFGLSELRLTAESRNTPQVRSRWMPAQESVSSTPSPDGIRALPQRHRQPYTSHTCRMYINANQFKVGS
jgi:hypothetical protein